MTNIKSNYDEWYPVCIAYILPGSGHLWLRKYIQGGSYFLGGIVIFLLFILCLLASQCPFSVLFFMLSVSVCYPFVVSYLTYIDIKRYLVNDVPKEKKCWLAIYLNMLIPGVGNLYLRRWCSAMLFFLLFVWFGLSMPFKISWPFLLIIRIVAILYVYLSFGPLQNKLIILFFCIFFAGTTVIEKHVVPQINHTYIYEIATIKGDSMAPAIVTNDVIVVSKIAYVHNKPKIGDIISYGDTNREPGEIALIKRVVAVEKENVTITDGELFIDGKLRKRYEAGQPSVQELRWPDRYIDNYMVPENHYYVLGDNFYNSVSDSRFAGAISRNKIVGRVTKIIWRPNRLACF